MSGKSIIFREIGNLPAGEQHLHLDLKGLDAGMYFYELLQGKSKITKKFIVK
jgi:hypothetical protein